MARSWTTKEYSAEEEFKWGSERIIEIWEWWSEDFLEDILPSLDELENKNFTWTLLLIWNWVIDSDFDLSDYSFEIIFKSEIVISIEDNLNHTIGWFTCDNKLLFFYVTENYVDNQQVTLHTIKLNKYTHFYFENFGLKLSLHHVVNTGRLVFDWAGSHKFKLSISDTDLWYTIFNGVELASLGIENVNLHECIFNWCIFPEYLDDILKNEQQKDNYRQLKFVMDKNWNYTEANKFYAKEMEYYEKTLGIEKKWFWWTLIEILKTVWFWWENRKRWERLTLLFSDLITEHWTNLTRWLFILFIFTLLSSSLSLSYLLMWVNLCNTIPLNNTDWCNNSLIWLNTVWVLSFLFFIGLFLFIRYQINKDQTDNKKNQENKDKELNIRFELFFLTFLCLVIIWISLTWGISYLIEDYTYNFNPLKHFISLLDPTYGLFKHQLSTYTTIELTYFMIYKIFYWIILWHIVVTARRIARR